MEHTHTFADKEAEGKDDRRRAGKGIVNAYHERELSEERRRQANNSARREITSPEDTLEHIENPPRCGTEFATRTMNAFASPRRS